MKLYSRHFLFIPARIVVGLWVVLMLNSATGQTLTPTQDTEPITPEYLLNALVRIATQEDLVDAKRIGSLLKLNIELQVRPAVQRGDGKTVISADGYVSSAAYSGGMHGLTYTQVTSPAYGAKMSIGFDRRQICINIKDVVQQFERYGTLRPASPPTGTPPPLGDVYPQTPKDQPLYGYWFTGQHSAVSLYFRYSNCLVEAHIRQHRNEK
jgi:hypothetical protein